MVLLHMWGNLNLEKRKPFAEKFMELGNLAAGALVFGQAFANSPFDFRIGLFGVGFLLATYIFAYKAILGGER